MDSMNTNYKNSPQMPEDCFCTKSLMIKCGDGPALVFGSIRFRKRTAVQKVEANARNYCSAVLRSLKSWFSFF